MNRDKKLYLEFLRIISIVLVIFNHTGTRGYFLWALTEKGILFWIYLFCSLACKIAVPLFWMISGSLLLAKEETIWVLYRKRIFKMGITLLVFSFLQYLYLVHTDDTLTFSLFTFCKKLYGDKLAVSYWYLYAYLGMLLLLPMLRSMAKHMSRKEYLYLFALSLIIHGLLPMAEYLVGQGRISVNANLTAAMFTQNMILFLAGHYFGNVIDEKELSGKKVLLFLGSGLAAIMLSGAMTLYKANVQGSVKEGESQTFYMSLILIPTGAVFYAARYFFGCRAERRRNVYVEKLILLLGSAAFGVMLMENIGRDSLLWIYQSLFPYCGRFFACILWVLAVWIVGTIVILLLKRVPGIKRLL